MKSLIHKFCATNVIISLIFTTTVVAADGVTTTDANGYVSNTQTVTFEGKSDDGIINSITAVAVGMITARMLLKYKPKKIDVILASAAGAAYLAGEVLAVAKYTKNSKKQEVEVTVSTKTDEDKEKQLEILKELLKNAEDANKTIKTKAMLQKASAAAYLAAAAAAVVLQFTEKAAIQVFKASVLGFKAGLKTMATTLGANPSTSSQVPLVTGTETMVDGGNKAIQAFIQGRQTGGSGTSQGDEIKVEGLKGAITPLIKMPGLGPAAPIKASFNQAAEALLKVLDGNETSAVGGNMASNKTPSYLQKLLTQNMNFEEKKSVLEKILSIAFPEAQAGYASLLGYGAGAAASLTVLDKTLAKTFDAQMHIPAKRAIVWVALAGLTSTAAKSSESASKDIESQIEKIKVIIANMETMTKGIRIQEVKQQNLNLASAIKIPVNNMQFSSDGTDRFPCMTSNASSDCASVEEEFKAAALSTPELGLDLMTTGTNIAKMADSLQGQTGLTGSAITSVETVANSANAIRKAKDAQDARLRKLNKANNLADNNHEKDGKNLGTDLKNKVSSILKDRGLSAGGFLSSLSGGSGSNSVASAEDLKKLEDENKLKKGEAGGQGIVAIPAATIGSEEYKLDEDKTGLADATAAPGVSDAMKANEDLEMAMADINKDDGASIFQIISNRYLKSGYPKLLEEEKSPAK